MNFEHLIHLFINKHDKIKNKKKAWNNILNEASILKLKKEKLKLGKTIFEVRDLYYGDIIIYEELEMIHCRQDNTDAPTRRLERLIDWYSWKWDFDNMAAAFLILYFVYMCLKTYFCNANIIEIITTHALDELPMQTLMKFTIFSVNESYAICSQLKIFYTFNTILYILLGDLIIFFKLI